MMVFIRDWTERFVLAGVFVSTSLKQLVGAEDSFVAAAHLLQQLGAFLGELGEEMITVRKSPGLGSFINHHNQ